MFFSFKLESNEFFSMQVIRPPSKAALILKARVRFPTFGPFAWNQSTSHHYPHQFGNIISQWHCNVASKKFCSFITWPFNFITFSGLLPSLSSVISRLCLLISMSGRITKAMNLIMTIESKNKKKRIHNESIFHSIFDCNGYERMMRKKREKIETYVICIPIEMTVWLLFAHH